MVFCLFIKGDGIVNIWDINKRKRVKQFESYKTSISDIAFNHTGDLLAVSSSYTFEEGEKEYFYFKK